MAPICEAYKKKVAIKKLANTFGLNSVTCQYEADGIAVDPRHSGDLLINLQENSDYPNLSKIVKLGKLFCPNNMNVERGFSIQNPILTKGCKMTNELYEAIRHIKNFFNPAIEESDDESNLYEKRINECWIRDNDLKTSVITAYANYKKEVDLAKVGPLATKRTDLNSLVGVKAKPPSERADLKRKKDILDELNAIQERAEKRNKKD